MTHDVSAWQRRLLPGDLLELPDQRRSMLDWAMDLLAFLAAIGIGILVLVDDGDTPVPLGLDIPIGVACCLALWIRRTRPEPLAIGITLASAISGMAAGAALVITYNTVVRARPQFVLNVFLPLTIAAVALYPALYPDNGEYDVNGLIVGALLTAVVFIFGLFTRARTELIQSMRARSEQLEQEQTLRIDQAREAERRRIAREMHDVLAHRISLLSVHAGALEYRKDASAEEVSEAAGVIRRAARDALQELRDVVGVLRDDEPDHVAPPQPTLADIPALLDECRAVDMRVEARIEIDQQPPDALGRTAYRIVQEGLTNARKHAPGAAVDVRIAGTPSEGLTVRVANRRPVAVVAEMPGAGTGLIGLAERVELAGGTLSHGPDAEGDHVLEAVLPWP